MSAYHGMSRDDLIKRLDEETARADRNGRRADRLEAELTQARRALREAADEVTADLERQGGDATGQYAVGMKRAAFLIRRRADEIGGA